MVIGPQRLRPHPAAPPDAIAGVSCAVSWRDAGEWVFDFIVAEPPEALRLPLAAEPLRTDGLWRATCFELFLSRPGEDAYVEFNFSPSGQWAVYRFDRYREGGQDLKVAPPLVLTADPEQFALAWRAHLERRGLEPEVARLMAAPPPRGPGPGTQFSLTASFEDPAFGGEGPWLAGLSAVIEEAHGQKSYWALAHGSDKPDFHHPDSFVLELP